MDAEHYEKLRYAVERSAEQFEFYEQQHLAKVDGFVETGHESAAENTRQKAFVNRELAQMCRDALKESVGKYMEPVAEDMRPVPCDYVEQSPDRPEKTCQNYSQANNLELSHRIMGIVAPHWDKTVRQASAGAVSLFLSQQLTRMWDDICTFHHKFGLQYDGPPRDLDGDLGEFRGLFMVEEVEEYLDLPRNSLVNAAKELRLQNPRQPDSLERRANQLDALVDLVYVALGTAYLHGFNFAEAWRRVQRANVSKVRALKATDSKRGSTFDVVKPPGWTAPDHSDLVGTLVPINHTLPEDYAEKLREMSAEQRQQFLEGEFPAEPPKQHDLF